MTCHLDHLCLHQGMGWYLRCWLVICTGSGEDGLDGGQKRNYHLKKKTPIRTTRQEQVIHSIIVLLKAFEIKGIL